MWDAEVFYGVSSHAFYIGGTIKPVMACRLFALELVQVGGGEFWGRTTGAKALFCLTAEIILTGEKEKMPVGVPELAPDGRVIEEAPSGGLAGIIAYGELAVEPLRKLGDTGTPRLVIPAPA